MAFGDVEIFTRQYLCDFGPRVGESMFLAKVEAVVATVKYELLERLHSVIRTHGHPSAIEAHVGYLMYEANERIRQQLRGERLIELRVEIRDRCFFVSLERSKELDVMIEHDTIKTVGYLPGEDVPRPESFAPARKVEV